MALSWFEHGWRVTFEGLPIQMMLLDNVCLECGEMSLGCNSLNISVLFEHLPSLKKPTNNKPQNFIKNFTLTISLDCSPKTGISQVIFMFYVLLNKRIYSSTMLINNCLMDSYENLRMGLNNQKQNLFVHLVCICCWNQSFRLLLQLC